MNWFKKIFYRKDWKTVKVLTGEWEHEFKGGWIFYNYEYPRKWTTKVIYEIQYSAYRNKFRIKMKGENPKEHEMYSEAIEMKMKMSNEI